MIIPYGKQTIRNSDIKAVIRVLSSDYITQGPMIPEFEEKFAKYVGAKYAVAVSNGTAALHVACLAAGLKKGQELITTPMTFAASANCALYCGARPVFVDINDENGLIDENLIEKAITPKTKIIIPVHYGGLPCNLTKIKEIARKHKVIVIEDACHALGARYKKSKIGDCKYSDMTIFSFHPVKHITTGEGGMITTNSKDLYQKLRLFRTHGITKDPNQLINKTEGPWYYEMQELGFNYRITDIQCALGISQLKSIKNFLAKRFAIANRYNKELSRIGDISTPKVYRDRSSAYHLYVIRVKNKNVRLDLFNKFKKSEIFCQVHYVPVHLHPFYRKLGYRRGSCPNAEEFYNQIISIPIYSGLKKDDQSKVIRLLIEYFSS
jgi:UDP-4-amino-4,6-dideoxy-N-acetyl-beta-L-altrosamine transaminase